MDALEHTIYRPESERWDFEGTKLAIVGYSHYDNGPHVPNFTVDLLKEVATGKVHLPFFTKISGYFKKSNEQFWPHVAFFNFVPILVGKRTDMRRTAYHLHEHGRERARQFIEESGVERVIVLSTKAWNHFCYSDEEKRNERCRKLPGMEELFPYRAEVGTYTAGERTVLALGLPHPERSKKAWMYQAIRSFLSIPKGKTEPCIAWSRGIPVLPSRPGSKRMTTEDVQAIIDQLDQDEVDRAIYFARFGVFPDAEN